jgi:hypothetical protein
MLGLWLYACDFSGQNGGRKKETKQKLRPGSELLFCFVSFFLQKKKKTKKKIALRKKKQSLAKYIS